MKLLLAPVIIGVLGLSWPGEKAGQGSELPFHRGEKITYTIKKMGVKAGEASLDFQGQGQIDGQAAYVMLFKATAVNFLDEERIFLDPKTFLPVRVDRNVNIWGKKEKINEYYDQKKGQVKIVKNAGGKTTEQVIKKGKPMENLYGFIYRYRKEGKFTKGDALQMNLPTMDVKLKLVSNDEIKVDGKKRKVFVMESDPAKYKVWFAEEEPKVPLRIDGAVGFGSTSMIMKDYAPGSK